jgi:DNA-binding response OmpR family regulator
LSKILIVEDDENILELEKDYIEASNMEAQGATNGNDGLELALNNDYDLILLDVMLLLIYRFLMMNKKVSRFFRYICLNRDAQ